MKKIESFDFVLFVGDVISGICFRPFWLKLLGFWLDGIFRLKFLLETMLESKSFEPVMGFLAFLVQKLRFENNKNW